MIGMPQLATSTMLTSVLTQPETRWSSSAISMPATIVKTTDPCGEDDRAQDDGPELAVAEHLGEVVEADRLGRLEAPELGLAELLEGQGDEPDQG